MNAIIGYTNLARKETEPAKIYDYLDKINSFNQHLLALINDILEMSRIENGKIELEYVPLDLCAVFEEIRNLFSEQMKQKNLDFQVHTGQLRNRYLLHRISHQFLHLQCLHEPRILFVHHLLKVIQQQVEVAHLLRWTAAFVIVGFSFISLEE